jgi:hypothetical protein
MYDAAGMITEIADGPADDEDDYDQVKKISHNKTIEEFRRELRLTCTILFKIPGFGEDLFLLRIDGRCFFIGAGQREYRRVLILRGGQLSQ